MKLLHGINEMFFIKSTPMISAALLSKSPAWLKSNTSKYKNGKSELEIIKY